MNKYLNGLTGGTLTALVCAVLMVGAFIWETAGVTMPPQERGAALSTFGVLALGYALLGSATVYDALGSTVRRDHRALAVLLALVPALYLSYSLAVREFSLDGVLSALAFVAIPALLLLPNQGRSLPTLPDTVAVLYVLLSLELALLPALTLPRLEGQVSFFVFASVPMLLVLLAARGWAGLGFTWYLSRNDLLTALLTAAALLAVLLPLAFLTGFRPPAAAGSGVVDLLIQAVLRYFLHALPQELLFRGVLQHGIVRQAEFWLRQEAQRRQEQQHPLGTVRRNLPGLIGLVLAALAFGLAHLNDSSQPLLHMLLATVAGLGYGWVYQRTGKVTAAAGTHMLVVWVLAAAGVGAF